MVPTLETHPPPPSPDRKEEARLLADVTPRDIRPVRHVRQAERCSACGRVFCVDCEGSNHGEPRLCERCFHVYLPHLEAA